MAYALGLARGAIHSVLIGDATPEDLRDILDGTRVQSLAAVLGIDESDLSVDWNDHLTEEEKWAIQTAERVPPDSRTKLPARTRVKKGLRQGA